MISPMNFIAMAADNPPVRKTKNRGFMHLLSSAACEWFLIFLLFVNAALSHLLTRFAHYCELKAPCLLCSRLESACRNKKPGYYWNLLCNSHRDEISCLVSCSIHGKFADVHGVCEECLAPIVNRSKSGPDSYRLLVGKSWLDVDRSVLQNLVLNKHIRLSSPDRRSCSCCSKTWRAKSGTERLIELNPVGFGASKANVKPPLPRAPGRSRFSRRDSLKRLRDKFTGQTTNQPTVSVDTLSHVGYTKLKISSDSESEFPFSEDDDDRSINFRVRSSENSHPSLLDLSEDKNGIFLSVDGFGQQGLGDFDWQESCKKPSPSLTPDLISLSDGQQQSDVALMHVPAISVLSEFLSLCNAVPSSPNTSAIPEKINVVGTSENGDTSMAIEAAVGTSSDNTSPLEPNSMHQIDASTQTDETIGFEPTNTSDSATTAEDIKSTSQVFTSESSSFSKESSPRAHDNKQDKPSSGKEDSSSSKVLLVSSSPKKTDSIYESFDGTNLRDNEGENIVDLLKCQVEHDRNLLSNLYKDLEDERNAAAIAASQAMAMITRLQEEKAALHMEALQYLRMMEEQAEYDMEALGRANDLLAGKEKELQDLEIELEFYRNNFLDELGVHNLQRETSVVDNRVSKENGICEPIDSLLPDFEDVKVYIELCLKKLEKKLRGDYSGRNIDDFPNGLYPVRDLEDLSPNDGTLLNGENEENGLIVENVISLSNGNPARDMNANDCLHEKREKTSENRVEVNSAAFEKEILELHDRLEALETDRNFIRCTSDLLRNGKDGLELVRDIAHQLRELRKMEFRTR